MSLNLYLQDCKFIKFLTIFLNVKDQQKIAKVGLEMKLLTAEVEAEAEKWDEYAENDIVKRAKVFLYNYFLL